MTTEPKRSFAALETEARVNGTAAAVIEGGRLLILIATSLTDITAPLIYTVDERIERVTAALLLSPYDTIAEGVETVRALPPLPEPDPFEMLKSAGVNVAMLDDLRSILDLMQNGFDALGDKREESRDVETGYRTFDTPDSSNVERVGYNDATALLFVRFTGTPGRYVYQNVPSHRYEALRRAASVGAALNVLIKKGEYAFTREADSTVEVAADG